MLADRVRHFRQPRPVFDQGEQIDRGKKFDAIGRGITNPVSRRRLATRMGTSCTWQFNTQAACSTVRRAGNWPSSCRN